MSVNNGCQVMYDPDEFCELQGMVYDPELNKCVAIPTVGDVTEESFKDLHDANEAEPNVDYKVMTKEYIVPVIAEADDREWTPEETAAMEDTMAHVYPTQEDIEEAAAYLANNDYTKYYDVPEANEFS